MADRRTPKPTGRRVRGYISDLVELSAPRTLWTALVYHQDYREDEVLEASAARVSAFAESPASPGIPKRTLAAPGVFAYDTGENRATRELLGASRGGIGWKASTEWFLGAARVLQAAYAASGLPSHGSLDPHRILVGYDGALQIIGFGLPRLDLVDFLDDASLLPPTEALRFTAPESLEGAEEDFGTDLFVLGLIATRLATGRHLYEGDEPKELLAAAADGEGRKALATTAPPQGVLDYLGPALEPWPEDRHASLEACLKLAETALASLEGEGLAAHMDELAETASDVEVDLPRGWKLPVPPPPLDDEQRENATRRLKRSHGEASRTLDRARTKLDAVAERDWSLSSTASEGHDEALRHLKAAQDSVAAAEAALERAAAAASHEALDHALAEGEDACDRARGANSESLRALDRALTELQKEEAARDQRLRVQRADRAGSLLKELDARLDALDQLDARTPEPLTDDLRRQAKALQGELQRYADAPDAPEALAGFEGRTGQLREALETLEARADREAKEREEAAATAAEAARVARVARLDERIVGLSGEQASWADLAEQAATIGGDLTAFRAHHQALKEALARATAMEGSVDPRETEEVLVEIEPVVRAGRKELESLLSDLRSAKDQAEAAAAHRARVDASLAEMRDQAKALAEQADGTSRGLVLAHPHADDVTPHVDELRSALSDVERTAEALAGLVLEDDDDPDNVLDAAQTHLQFARQAADRVQQAAQTAKRADDEETARLDAEQAERARLLTSLREQLAATGERVRNAARTAREKLDQAEQEAGPLLVALGARGAPQRGPLERALDALRQHHALLAGRQNNWEEMAQPASDLTDPDALEALVHTGDAEASFAEADVADLPDLHATYTDVLALARADQQVHDDALAAAHARITASVGRIETATGTLPDRLSIPESLTGRSALEQKEDALLRAAEAARSALATVRARAAIEPTHLPDDAWLDELDHLTNVAETRVREAKDLHAQLTADIDAGLDQQRREAEARDAATAAAEAALKTLTELADRAAPTVPPVEDPAVRERVAGTAAALHDALARFPEIPSVDIERDPHAAETILTPLVEPARLAADAIEAAHRRHVGAVEATIVLVGALREATASAEADADRAAVASASARDLQQGLMGSWPHLVERQAELRTLVELADTCAAGASREAERASGATDADTARQAAEQARAHADHAEEALGTAGPLATDLRADVEAARQEAAAADEKRRLDLIEIARDRTGQLTAHREALEEASSAAVTALENSPSSAARRAWEAADEQLDAANALLVKLDEALQNVFSASDADEAQQFADTSSALLEAVPQTIGDACTAAREAASLAHKEVAANEQLVVDLQARRIELDELAGEVREARHALDDRLGTLEDGLQADELQDIDGHTAHIAAAREDLGEAISTGLDARDEDERSALRERATAAVARATAARNTARALLQRLEGQLVLAEQQEQVRRAERIRRLHDQNAVFEARLHELDARVRATLAAPDIDALADAAGAVTRSMEACREVAAGSDVRLQEANPSTPGRVLEHLVRQGDRALERLEERATQLEEALQGVETARQALARRAADAHRAIVDRHDALLQELQERVDEGRHTAETARAGIESARPLLGRSPAAAARKAWSSAIRAVEASEGALGSALTHLDDWVPCPELGAPADTLAAAQATGLQIAGDVRRAVSQAIAEAGAVAGLIDMGMRSAEALAGILGEASAERERFQKLESDLVDRAQTLHTSMEAAPKTAASSLNTDADVQLGELTSTLDEARACLEELGEATSEEQAEALLQVATIALDIADAVASYTLPVIDDAISTATEEAEAERVRLERVVVAQTRLEELQSPARQLEEADAALVEAQNASDTFAHHPAVVEAAASTSRAADAVRAALPPLLHPIPLTEDPDALEAHVLEVTGLREVLDQGWIALDAARVALRKAIETAAELDHERDQAIAAARLRFQTAVDALGRLQSEARDLEASTLSESEDLPETGVLEREALRQATETLLALSVAAPTDETPEAWQATADTAEAALVTATETDFRGPAQALADAIQDARIAEQIRLERLAALQQRLDAARNHLDELLGLAAEHTASAKATAEEHPLETQLLLAALEAAGEARASVELPTALPADPEAATPIVEQAELTVDRLAEDDTAALLAEVHQVVEEALRLEAERAAALQRLQDRLTTARQTVELKAATATSALSQATELSADYPLEAALPVTALEAIVSSIDAVVFPENLPSDPEEAERLVEEVEDAVADLDQDPAELLDLVRQAVEDAQQAEAEALARRNAQQASFEKACKAFDDAMAHLHGLLDTARAEAADYPLEAGLPLAALEATLSPLFATDRPDTLPEDPEEADALLGQIVDRTATLVSGEAEALVAEVRTAIAEAQAEELAEQEAITRNHALLDELDAELSARIEASRARRSELHPYATWPELEASWTTFEAAHNALIETSVPTDRPQARPATDALLKRVRRRLEDLRDEAALADALSTDLQAAREAREDAQRRLKEAAALLDERIATATSFLPASETLPDTEPVKAAYRALEQALEGLQSLRVSAEGIEDAPTLLLRVLEAEEAADRAQKRDLEGLSSELSSAIQVALAAEEQEEADRLETLAQARTTVQKAVDSLTDALETRARQLAEVEDQPDPDSHRDQARVSLENARGRLVDLRSARQSLTDDLVASEAIAIAFDGEMLLATAQEGLGSVDEHVSALLDGADRLDRARVNATECHESLQPLLAAIHTLSMEAPRPSGEDAERHRDTLDTLGMEAEAARATAEMALEVAVAADRAEAAEGATAQLRSLLLELKGLAERARKTSDAIQQANLQETERRAAAQREEVAATRERANLGVERAERALRDITGFLEEASTRAEGHTDDPAIDQAFAVLAAASETVLGIIDEARRLATEAREAEDPTKASSAAQEAADRADQTRDEARTAVEAVDQRVSAIEREGEAARQEAEAAQLAQRDAKLPRLRKQIDAITVRLDRIATPEPTEDRELRAAGEAVAEHLDATRAAADRALEALQLLASAKAADVADFLREAEATIATTRTAATALKATLTAYYTEQEAARSRQDGLALEEARGRAWEACQLAQTLARELTSARSALPEPPTPQPPRVREAMDRLGDIERRLWRAGQRADEARERAGNTEDLETAQSAALAAEKAVGRSARWQREIDHALKELSELLKPSDTSDVMPRSERMRNLRRGRIQAEERRSATPAPARRRSAPVKDNPTEALLRRLRSGKKRGETGRDRLRRLREKEAPPAQEDRIEPVELDPVGLPPQSDYPSLQEFEDYQATTIGETPALRLDEHVMLPTSGPPKDGASEDTVVGAPPSLPEDEHTHAFAGDDDPDFEDAKTQAFNREMIEALLNAPAEEKSHWADEDGSTRWDTQDEPDRKR